MNAIIVTRSTIEARAKFQRIDSRSPATLALLAIDIVTDIEPQNDFRLEGTVESAIELGEFHFAAIQ